MVDTTAPRGALPTPAFSSPTTNPYGLSDVGGYASPRFADIDGDGDLDAFIGNSDGHTLVYLNTGTASSPAFAAAITNPYGLDDVGSSASPSLVDIDGDGDLDALIGNNSGNTLVYLNTGTASSPAFAAASLNPYGLSKVGYDAKPSFVDIDGDGDLDAFIGEFWGNTLFYLNTGTISSPAFAAAITNPYGLSDVVGLANPSLVDIDGDGDLDALIGNGSGNTLVFINTANPVGPVNSTTANGTYRVGSVINLTVSFNENVIVKTSDGLPTLALETGAIDRFATYVSGSGTNTLTFRYTVKAGDSSADLDFTSTSALVLNGGTIQDAAGNNAVLTLAVPGATDSLAANAALVIDGINDVLNGSPGADTMTGGQGDDRYYVDNAGDKVVETDGTPVGGTDTVYSTLTAYTLTSNVERGVIKKSGAANMTGNDLDNKLYGGAGDNALLGLAGNDYLNGGAGKDKLVGGQGPDTMVGGDGNDAYYVENAGDVVTETQANAAVGGIDTVYSYLAAYTLGSNVERGVINTTGAANLTGNALDNTLYGNASNNKLTGVAGNDYLIGDAGDDILSGGSGNDRLTGGLGADRLTGGLDADTFVIDSGGGRDVISDFSFAQGDKINLRSNLNGSGITSAATALANVHDVAGKAVLDIGNGNIVILLGVQTAELSASDFAIF
ncbi:MAG: FG-GAP-like repeat-containing protein [Pseudomonadota bacterium]